MLNIARMRGIAVAFALFPCTPSIAADRIPWPSTLPVYDHIVIVIEENKDVEQIFGSRFDAPYIRKLAAEGAVHRADVWRGALQPRKLFLAILRQQSKCGLFRSSAKRCQ